VAHLDVAAVTFGYGREAVLREISLTAIRGQFIGLIGPNASGKSTLVRAMSGVVRPWRGTVTFDGRDLAGMTPQAIGRRIAVMEQDTAPAFDFAVREFVGMGRYPHLPRFGRESAADRSAVNQAMELAGVSGLAERRMDHLSGGERQRVVLARTLAQQPELLMLDEPTSHLDINHQVEVLDVVRDLNRRAGLTVIAVLHDLNLAAAYCEILVLLRDGRIFAVGQPNEVLTAANVEEVYGARVIVDRSPAGDYPRVTTLPGGRLPPDTDGTARPPRN
jgi:iron complex transport system ATP-binding protein